MGELGELWELWEFPVERSSALAPEADKSQPAFFFLVEKRKKKEKGLCYGVFRLISVNVTEGIGI